MFEGFWFILAIATALLYGGHSVYVKALLEDVDQMMVTWTLFALAFPVYFGILLLQGVPAVDPAFYLPLTVSLVINLVAWPFFIRAIQISDVSLVMPMVALTPAFMIGVEYLWRGAVPGTTGLFGILAIVVGTYVLNIRDGFSSLLAPIRSLLDDKGARYMLFVAAVWSVSATAEKLAIDNSSPTFYLSCFAGLFAVCFFPVLLRQISNPVRVFKKHWLLLGGSALLIAVMSIAQMTAVEQTPLVNYVIAIKRTGMLVSVVLGIWLFGEKQILFRSIGAVLMVAGVILIRIA